MTVPALFAVIGGVILAGFLANLVFRLTRIPAVLLLIATGILLGPVTGWLESEALVGVAPFFGAVALLIILFEGGLELEIGHVVRQAPRAAVLAVLVFALSMLSVAAFARFAIGLAPLAAALLGAVLAATSPAICMPVVSGLPVRDEVKTIVKLESALGDVLLIVTVLLLVDLHASDATGAASGVWRFVKPPLVAVAVSSVAGALWARLVGWMGQEPLAYMLTLGVVFLLYFAVEELGGSAPIAVLVFGLILANMGPIATRFGPRFREATGIHLREDQFALNQFVMRITAELSFLVRTFFFVYLGLLTDLRALSWSVAAQVLAIGALLLASRGVGIAVLARGRHPLGKGERQMVMALGPRGLATAVMAFVAVEADVAGTALLPLYAFAVIILSNLFMAGGVIFADRQLKRERDVAGVTADEAAPAAGEPGGSDASGGAPEIAGLATRPLAPAAPVAAAPAPRESEGAPPPASFADWMARVFGLDAGDRAAEYADLAGAAHVADPIFWVQAVLGGAICALGLILDQSAIIIGGALIVPLARPVVATGLAVAAGDVYLLAKLAAKLLVFAAVVMILSALLVDLLPFSATTPEIAARTRPMILDFLVALCAGMAGAALLSVRSRGFHYLPGAVMAITLLPALCVMGFGLGRTLAPQTFRGGGLLFTANLFANVIGAGLVLALAGLPRAAESEPIRAWRARELSAPLARSVFGRPALRRLVGRTGSVRARMVVIALFLLLLLIPLQSAFNELTAELRARQAVADVQRMFDVRGRSALLRSSSTVTADQVHVRLQVATNALFDAQDIARFEERMRDRTGRATRLDLVQTLSDMGQADKIRPMLAGPQAAPPASGTADDAARALGAVTARALDGIPLPSRVRIASVRTSLPTQGDPRLDVVYLSESPVDDDAREVLLQLVEQRTGFERRRVGLQWMPDAQRFEVSREGRLERAAQDRLGELGATLARMPGVAARLELPAGLAPAAADRLASEVRQLIAVPDLQAGPPGSGATAGVALVRLRLTSGTTR